MHESQVFVVLCHRVFIRCRVLQRGDGLGKVRGWDLHFVDFIKVCLCPVEWVVVERASNVVAFPDRSNDYSINDGIISDWKALLLNKVVVGNGVKLAHADTTLTRPPPGYDSVSIFWLVHSEDIDQGLGSCGSGPWRKPELR